MKYWTEHEADFKDAKRRGDALNEVALAIKKSSGEDITPKQIMTKFARMWERKRTLRYEKATGGTHKLFELGPECLDREKLHLNPVKSSDSVPSSEGEKHPEALVILSKPKSSDREKRSNRLQLGKNHGEQIQLLQEQLSSIQKENTTLKGALEAKDAQIQILRETKHIHEHITSSGIGDRGPLDKEVRDRVQGIIKLIRLNANTSSNEYFDGGSRLSFSEMKAGYKQLYQLHQQAFSFDLDDEITLARLGHLGIHSVGKSHMMRALIGIDILQEVFRSSFPDFCHDRGSAALLYEQVIEEQSGPIARAIFIQSAQYTFIKTSKFSERIVPAKAARMSHRLNDLLFPLREVPTSDGIPLSHDIWESQEQSLQDVFTQSLMLRADLRLNLDRYDFFWPPPNTLFNKETMASDNEDSQIQSSKEIKVAITLFPGIRAWDPESLAGRDNSDTDEDGCRAVVKALVLTH